MHNGAMNLSGNCHEYGRDPGPVSKELRV